MQDPNQFFFALPFFYLLSSFTLTMLFIELLVLMAPMSYSCSICYGY